MGNANRDRQAEQHLIGLHPLKTLCCKVKHVKNAPGIANKKGPSRTCPKPSFYANSVACDTHDMPYLKPLFGEASAQNKANARDKRPKRITVEPQV